MILTSYFTSNGQYPALTQRLVDSCKRFSVRHEVVKIDDQGDWMKTVNMKPWWILNQLLKHRQPILWCDCDCEIVADLAGEVRDSLAASDVAVYNWFSDPGNNYGYPTDPAKCRCAGGVMYFAYTAPSFEILIRWVEAVSKSTDIVEDQIFDKLWLAHGAHHPSLRLRWLPITWNWMTAHRGQPGPGCVIRHDYVSGRHRQALGSTSLQLNVE